jgi:peptidoglycan/xylan/chitin deacetylase (PgdA/CDA1 family)
VTISAVNARPILRWLWADILATSGCLWWAKRQLRRSGAIVPLTFHRVLRDADYRRTHSLPGVALLEQTFRDLVAHVARRYEPVDLRKSKPGVLSRRIRVALTFDDGWIDTYTVAFPIACEYGIPFIVFVCPGLMDDDKPFWPEQVVALMHTVRPSARAEETEKLIESLKIVSSEHRERYLGRLRKRALTRGGSVESTNVDRTLSWAAIAEMRRRGVSIGSHTQTHQIVTEIPPDVARWEVRTSKAAIESALPVDCDTFAYPNGNWSPETRNILAEAGFKLAVTTSRGAWTTTSDYLAIPRSNICEDNVTGPSGRFSITMFEYTTIWKAWTAMKVHSRLQSKAHNQPTLVRV